MKTKKLVGLAVAGTLLVGGCKYATQKEPVPIVQTIDYAALGIDPASYLNAATDFFKTNPDEMAEYAQEVAGLMRAGNDLELKTEDRMYLFETNSRKVPVDYGMGVCDELVSRAGEEKQLQYLVDMVTNSDVRNYDNILVAMVERVGFDLISSLQEALSR